MASQDQHTYHKGGWCMLYVSAPKIGMSVNCVPWNFSGIRCLQLEQPCFDQEGKDEKRKQA